MANTSVSPPPQRIASHPPIAATSRRARLPITGHNNRPAPCDAKYSTSPTPKNPYTGPTARKYNVGIVFKRALGQGRVTRIEGLGNWMHEAGKWVVEDKLFRPGTHRRNWKNTLLSDGHVIVRHPDWAEAYRLSFAAATGIKMYAE